MHSTCNLEEHGLLLEKNTPGATAVRGEHETKLQFHQNWKMRTGLMNLSSYLSDGRGVGENNMKAPIQPACINVSNWWWWCNGIGDFFSADFGPIGTKLKIV